MQYRRKHDRHRPRGWFSLFVRLGGWVSFIFGVALFAATLFSAGFLFLADQVDRAGAFARAAVVEKRVEGDRYFVTFAYKTSAGGRQAETAVERAFYEAAQVDDGHVIRYLRADPGRIEQDISGYRRSGVVLRWIGLVIGVLGLAALWFFGRRANRAVIVRRDGEKRYAEVTGILEMNVEINERRQGRLQWREQDGQAGESLMRDVAELGRLYKAGDRVVVFRLGDEAYWEGDVGPPWREVERGG